MAQLSNPSRSFSTRPQHDYTEPVAVTDTSTVIAKYQADATSATGYQSESALENALIAQLERQAYEYADIRSASAMRENARAQLEKLNVYQFSDAEWETFYKTEIANPASGIVDTVSYTHL